MTIIKSSEHFIYHNVDITTAVLFIKVFYLLSPLLEIIMGVRFHTYSIVTKRTTPPGGSGNKLQTHQRHTMYYVFIYIYIFTFTVNVLAHSILFTYPAITEKH